MKELTGKALDIRNKRADLLIELLDVDAEAKEFCQDKDNSLDDRWALFSTGFGDHKMWIQHFPGEWDDIINDGEYVNRNQVVKVAAKINGHTEESDRRWAKEGSPWLDDNKVNALKEHVLQSWVKSYEFDW